MQFLVLFAITLSWLINVDGTQWQQISGFKSYTALS